jgi:hypothetical protein
MIANIAFAGGLKAYYTRLDYEDKISGKHADIVVEVDDIGRLVFSRETSYLPFWQTNDEKITIKEIVRRRGDGDFKQPDKYNRYSYVRIIENDPERVIVHWRYYPDFLRTRMTDVVHEIFTITADGKVARKVKEASEKIYSWMQTEQLFQLNQNGIKEISFHQRSIHQNEYMPVKSAAIKENKKDQLAAYWSFDEGLVGYSEFTKENISNIDCPISGHKSYWKKGVSGSALQFDGYYSGIKYPVEYSPKIAVEFTIEAWIAMAVHPFGWVPIIQQSHWKTNGYYLGINAGGQVGFHWNNNTEWRSIITDKKIDINRWTHVAVTFNENSEKVVIYIDGEPQATGKIDNEKEPSLIHANAPLTIGLNNDQLMPLARENFTYGQYPCITGFEGAIDEVSILNSELSGEQIKRFYFHFKSDETFLDNPDFDNRVLPGHPGKGKKFGAYYTKLKYHKLWDNLWRTSDWPDIVVKFDELPTSIVFWRGPTYGPGWVTEKNYWMVDQSVESGNIVSYGEHMSDKQGRYNHVRLIENTEARTVIHWRYNANDVLYSFLKPYGDAGVWVDEYWTIYPDGIGIRKVNKKAVSSEVKRESIDWEDRSVEKIAWQDVQFLAQPGMTPDDVMNLQAVDLANLMGETAKMDWTDGIPPDNPLPSANIERINFKSDYKVFLIFQDGTYINPWGRVPRDMYCHFMTWNHWPVAMITSQGKSSLYPDRVTHSALCAADNAVDHGDMAMYGFTKRSVETLIPLAKSWCNPPQIINLKGAKEKGYLKEERAYHLVASSDFIVFDINASEDSPIINPCFIIKNYGKQDDAEIFINNKRKEEGSDFRQGNVLDTDGKVKKIIWLKSRLESPLKIQIK